MWLMVFFDLPVTSKPERRAAAKFRHFLRDDGYMMLQYSVYARVCRAEGRRGEKHVRRVVSNLPGSGSVRALQVTDRQFGRTQVLLGQAPKTETLGAAQMVLL